VARVALGVRDIDGGTRPGTAVRQADAAGLAPGPIDICQPSRSVVRARIGGALDTRTKLSGKLSPGVVQAHAAVLRGATRSSSSDLARIG